MGAKISQHEASQREATPPSLNKAKALESTEPKPLPQNYQDILKDADSPIDTSSEEKLRDLLYSGVFLNRNTKKYWVNQKSNCNCFMLYARTLSVVWANTPEYWKWLSLEDQSSGTMIEVAELLNVCWLEVTGKFDMSKLSPGILYEVSFVVKLEKTAEGWETPVNVRLVLRGGKKQDHNENFEKKLRKRWIEIPAGQFVASADGGEVEFSMTNYSQMWKRGLFIKGVSIKPNPNNFKLLRQEISK